MSGGSAFRDRFKAQLKKCSAELDSLDEQSKVFGDSLKAKFKEREPEFRSLIKEGEESVERLASLTDNEIDHIKGSLEFTAHAIKNSLDVFSDQFKENQQKNKDD